VSSPYEERKRGVVALADETRAAVDAVAVPDPFAETTERLAAVLAYITTVVQRSDFRFVSDDTHHALSQTLVQVRDYARQSSPSLFQSLPALTNGLLDTSARLPGRRTREQAIARLVAEFKAEARQGLEELANERSRLGSQLVDLEGGITASENRLQAAVAQLADDAKAAVARLESAIAAQEQRASQTATEQAERFREAQDERADQFKAQLEAGDHDLEALRARFEEAAGTLIGEIERMRDESAQLVGAIGVTGTAERYDEEARSQKKAADNWRRGAVAFAAVAVLVALWAAFHTGQTTENLVAKLGIGLALGGIAAYCARQSARHRRREEDARAIQLDLAAFGPFIEALPQERKDEERIALGRKLFGHRFARKDLSEAIEAGPSALGELLNRRGGGKS